MEENNKKLSHSAGEKYVDSGNEISPLKTIIPAVCPHDGKPIYLNILITPPVLTRILTEDDVINAKNNLRTAIGILGLSDDIKTELYKWLDEPDTVFGPDDAPGLLENIKTNYLK